ncbi:MAG: response regulator, partial [Gammaproteobacteria bacterium]
MSTPAAATTNILVVEDQRAVAGALRMRLRGLGYGVLDIAKDGDEAIEKAAQLRPDLILMDIRLGDGIDGIEAARRIRSKFDIPVVYVTAYADHELLDRARETSPAGFINKPFTTKDLLTTLNLALNREPTQPRGMEQLRDAVVTTDRDGRISFINHSAEELTGWQRQHVLGRPLSEALHVLHGLPDSEGQRL